MNKINKYTINLWNNTHTNIHTYTLVVVLHLEGGKLYKKTHYPQFVQEDQMLRFLL